MKYQFPSDDLQICRNENRRLNERISSLESELAIAKAGISCMEKRLQQHQTNGNISETHREDR